MTAVGLALALGCFVAACGDGTSKAGTADRVTLPTAAGSPSSGASSGVDSGNQFNGKPLEKLRVANFYTAKGGGPGPTLDVYEFASGSNGAPTRILKDLAYGTISEYVEPPTAKDSIGGRSFLLGATVAGSKVATSQDLTGMGGAGSNPPEYDPQVTIMLTADQNDQEQMSGDLAGLSSGILKEKLRPEGTTGTPITLPPRPSGGELIVDMNTFQLSGSNLIYYLTIDGTCAKPTNGDPNDTGPWAIFASQASQAPGSIYEVAPGSHALTIGISAKQGTPPTSCDALVKLGDGTVQADAGTQVLVLPYSSDKSKTVQFASAPIAP